LKQKRVISKYFEEFDQKYEHFEIGTQNENKLLKTIDLFFGVYFL
jgi:hypothetical protein